MLDECCLKRVQVVGIAVDPSRDLLVVSTYSRLPGGVTGLLIFGRTDEVGLYAVENKVHLHDIHATILHLLGLDHEQLTFPHNGRDERPTINDGQVITKLLA